MNYDILKKYMMSFSTVSLRSYLGDDLVETLLEWDSGSEPIMTKKRLAELIIGVYGLSILKGKDFRKNLIKRFPNDYIMRFKECLPSKYNSEEDPTVIVEVVSNSSWTENSVNERLLEYLNFTSSDVFEKKEDDEESVVSVDAFSKFYELLDYQYIIRQRALNILNSGYDLRRFLIHMPTGTGKTKTAMHIICHYYNYCINKSGLIVWLAHTTELLQQAYETFVNVWRNIGDGSINVYKLWGKHNLPDDIDNISGIVICGIQKLMSIECNNKEVFNAIVKNVRLIVYDEAHKASATESKNLIEQLMNRQGGLSDRALMGLSATPGRSTELSVSNDILVSMFGNKIIGIDTKLMNQVNMSAQEAANANVETDVIKYFQDRGVLAKIKKEELSYDDNLSDAEIEKIKVIATDNGYDDFSKSTLEMIGKNKKRNQKILSRLIRLNEEKKPTIVFACSVRHGQLLSSMLRLKGVPNALIIGSMSSVERRESILRFKNPADELNILINYEVLTTGFDATNIECVFIARPTQSVVLYSQMLGRGLRGPQMGGNEECLLIDVKDNLKQFNENMAFSHFNDYWTIGG
ncbi:MAG: DEAD/DEAH box helicase [Eubacterium sp.]|nr:DEAD/DEAH box helicase [Eubacterium sp.]